MRILSTYLALVYFSIEVIGDQSTNDIIVTVEISNPNNKTAVRIIRKGEILSNNEGEHKSQILSIYDVFPQKEIIKNLKGEWLVTIPSNQSVRFRVKCRCINKGLKLPAASAILPTNTIFASYNSLSSQDSTWNKIESNKNIFKYHCAKIKRCSSCEEGIEDAVTEIFSENNISIHRINYLKINDAADFEIESLTPLGIPVKFVNIKYSCASIDSLYDVVIQGDIHIDEKYHPLFGKFNKK